MTLEEMDLDPRNNIEGRYSSYQTAGSLFLHGVTSDLSLPEHRGVAAGHVTSYCMAAVHNPIHCPDIMGCACHCHAQTGRMRVVDPLPNDSGTQLGAPNVPSERERRRRAMAGDHRSVECSGKKHIHPTGCKHIWCDCFCHKNESENERLMRAIGKTNNPVVQAAVDDINEKIRQTQNNHSVRVGKQIGHRVFVDNQDGRGAISCIMLPSGELIYPESAEE